MLIFTILIYNFILSSISLLSSLSSISLRSTSLLYFIFSSPYGFISSPSINALNSALYFPSLPFNNSFISDVFGNIFLLASTLLPLLKSSKNALSSFLNTAFDINFCILPARSLLSLSPALSPALSPSLPFPTPLLSTLSAVLSFFTYFRFELATPMYIIYNI